MEDGHKEIRTVFREQQVKLTYYLVALSVAGIGFCINKTSGQPFYWTQLPIFIAIILWGTSAWYGIRFLEINLDVLWQNHGLFVVAKAEENNAIKLAKEIHEARSSIGNNLKGLTKRLEKAGQWQNRLFYSGFIFYIIGHLLEMYLKTFGCN